MDRDAKVEKTNMENNKNEKYLGRFMLCNFQKT